MNRMIEFIKSLPRAGQWAVLAGTVFGAYFVIIEPALELQQRWAFKADQLQATLDQARTRTAAASGDESMLANGAARFGAIRFPVDSRRIAEQDLNRRIVEIFQSHGIDTVPRETRAPASLGRQALSDVIPPESEVNRLIVDIEFEASPETAMAIIADLEGSDVIHGLGRVHIKRPVEAENRLVEVNVSPETWYIQEKGS